MIVPTPDQLRLGTPGVYRPSMSNGTAQALAMTEKDVAEVKRREKKRLPFGFRRPA